MIIVDANGVATMTTTSPGILTAIRSVLSIVEDPHEFATAYVNHVANTGTNALTITAAAHRFVKTGRI